MTRDELEAEVVELFRFVEHLDDAQEPSSEPGFSA